MGAGCGFALAKYLFFHRLHICPQHERNKRLRSSFGVHIVGQAGDRNKALAMCYSDDRPLVDTVFFTLCVEIPHIILALLSFLQNFSRLLAWCDSVVEAGQERTHLEPI